MTQRITVTHVRQAFRHLCTVAMIHGIKGTQQWVLHEGSQTNGQPWRIYRNDAESNTPHNILNLSDGYIGWTAREADMTLRALARGMEASTKHLDMDLLMKALEDAIEYRREGWENCASCDTSGDEKGWKLCADHQPDSSLVDRYSAQIRGLRVARL